MRSLVCDPQDKGSGPAISCVMNLPQTRGALNGSLASRILLKGALWFWLTRGMVDCKSVYQIR